MYTPKLLSQEERVEVSERRTSEQLSENILAARTQLVQWNDEHTRLKERIRVLEELQERFQRSNRALQDRMDSLKTIKAPPPVPILEKLPTYRKLFLHHIILSLHHSSLAAYFLLAIFAWCLIFGAATILGVLPAWLLIAMGWAVSTFAGYCIRYLHLPYGKIRLPPHRAIPPIQRLSGSVTSDDSATTVYRFEPPQSIFSIKDGSEISNSRRATRKRAGPLLAATRQKAALIRKHGACPDCRRRRVACHPNHHNMSWGELDQKYRSSEQSQKLTTTDRNRLPYPPSSQEIGVHTSVIPQSQSVTDSRTRLSDTRIRTPLPSRRGLKKHMPRPPPPQAATTQTAHITIPHLEFVKERFESIAAEILSSPQRRILSSAQRSWYGNVDSNDGPHLTLRFGLTEESLSTDNWVEWLRMMPEDIRHVKVEGPFNMIKEQ
ncbi:hypothetical protein F4808DRAFT_465398 [Astrocystis sublimbata]|nr:hypothetical protein F4808DRAFT_465398 [Astrocystis sublimbata]